MRQAAFIAAREDQWQAFAECLKAMRRRKRTPDDVARLPERYRQLCGDLALARSRGYSLNLIHRLEDLVSRGHAVLYRSRAPLASQIIRFLAFGFPALVRSEWRLSVISLLLLFGPMLWLFLMIGSTPEFVYRVLDPEAIERIEFMYSQSDSIHRSADQDLFMFGFYIMNNIGVALRTFAGGLVFGIGSALILLFNGTQIGAVAAHLTFEGYHENFWTFVIGHGPFELPAIALAGAAGLRLGLSLIAPGSLTRIEALRRSARTAVLLLYGVMAMLFLAAALEAFWSASAAAATTKYIVGTALWLAVGAWLTLSGRRRSGAVDAD